MNISHIMLDADTCKLNISNELQAITFDDFFELLTKNAIFSIELSDYLVEVFKSPFFIEFPPLNIPKMSTTLEFVIIRAPQLESLISDSSSFSDKFETHTHENGITSFPNLSGTSILIVPLKLDIKERFTHIFDFLKLASPEQKIAFWKKVSQEFKDFLNTDKMSYLSTCGLGVPWLHMRIDPSPKYYSYAPYKKLL